MVADAHRHAQEQFLRWDRNGKPTSGNLYNEMRGSRKIFKSRVKCCQDHTDQLQMDVLAACHAKHDFKSFWKQSNRVQSKAGVPVSADGVRDSKEIVNLFKEWFFFKSPLKPS